MNWYQCLFFFKYENAFIFFQFDLFARAEICKKIRWIFGPNETPKRPFEINWPLDEKEIHGR